MDRKEAKKLLGVAVGAFPNMQEKNLGPTVGVWEEMLRDMPYEVAEKAMYKLLSTAKFFPTIAEIREAAVEITQPQRITASEAWGLITKAIRQYGYYRWNEAKKVLPADVVTMVERFSWEEICTSEETGVIYGQFAKAWDSQQKVDKQMDVLPTSIRSLVTGIADAKQLAR